MYSTCCLQSSAQNSLIGDGFGGRLWYRPVNYSVGSYSGYTVCGDSFQLYGWGANNYKQLGHNNDKGTALPIKIQNMDQVKYYSAGYNMGAIKFDNSGWAWGKPLDPVPQKVIDSVFFVDAGISNCTFIKMDGTVWSLGINKYGSYGNGQVSDLVNYIPEKMENVNSAVRVANGAMNNIVLLRDGTLLATGSNKYGGLGIGYENDTIIKEPIAIPGLKNIVDVKSAAYTYLALDSKGDVYVWGIASFGAIGNGLAWNGWTNKPEKVEGLKNIVAISGCNDGEHFMALDVNQNCYSWGYNKNGQLGNDTNNNFESTPQLVATGVLDILAGETFSYIVKADSSLWASGTTFISGAASIWLNLNLFTSKVFVKLDPESSNVNLCGITFNSQAIDTRFIKVSSCFNYCSISLNDTSDIVKIEWDFGDSSAKSSLYFPKHLYQNKGLYTIRCFMEKGNGDKDTVELEYVVLADQPKLELGNDTSLCQGEELILQSNVNLGVNYLWQDGTTDNSFTVTKEGLYALKVSKNGCHLFDTINVSYFSKPIVNLVDSLFQCGKFHAKLDAGIQGLSYKWSTGDTTQMIMVDSLGLYKVRVSNKFCSSEDSIIVVNKNSGSSNIFIPTSFSPNEDNMNEYFPDKNGITEFKLDIYSKWGELLYSGTEFWNGKYKDERVQNGVYLFIIEYRDCQNHRRYEKGSVTILY